MASLEKKMEVVLLNHLFKETYMEDIRRNETIKFYIAAVTYAVTVNYDKEKHQLVGSLHKFPDLYTEIVKFTIDCPTNVKKEGFISGHDPISSGYLKCFLEASRLENMEIKYSLILPDMQAYFEEEYEKIMFLLDKSLGIEIKQRQIDHPKEKIYNQVGIECCAVLSECLERMYFESGALLKVRREVYINDKIVRDVHRFFTRILFYLVGEIENSSIEFLYKIQYQLNSHSEKESAEYKLAYLLFLSTCLNEMVVQSLNESDGIHRQVEYTNNKKIEEIALFIFKNYLQMELPPNSMNIEEVLKTFYRNKEREKNNGKILQKISRLFRRES